MKKKYKILKDQRIVIQDAWGRDIVLYCIKALRDFGDVKKGDLGGYVESANNLSHEGDCWIYDDGKACRGARISENAKVYNKGMVFGATMKGNSCAYDDVIIFDDAIMEDYSKAYGESSIGGRAHLKGYACAYDHAKINGNVIMQDYAKACGNTWVVDDSFLCDYACASENSKIGEHAQLKGNSKAYGKSVIKGDTILLNSEVYENTVLTTGCYENEIIPLPKYELTDETITIHGHVLHRIRALRDFGDVKMGDLGGFVESENNLSHQGTCWIYDNAKVFEEAQVLNDGKIKGKAKVCGTIIVKDFAQIKDNVIITGEGLIIKDYAKISENVYLIASEKNCFQGYMSRYSFSLLNEDSYNYNKICGTANISGNVKIICEGDPTQITDIIHEESDLKNNPHFRKIYIPTTEDLEILQGGISKLYAFSELIDKKIEYLNEKNLNNNPNKIRDEHDLEKIQFFAERIKTNIKDAAIRYKTVLFMSDEEFDIFCDEAKAAKYVFSEEEYDNYIQEFGAFSKEDEVTLLKKEIIKTAENISYFKILHSLAAEEKDGYINSEKEDVYNIICNNIATEEKKIMDEISSTAKFIGLTERELDELFTNTPSSNETYEKAKEMYANIKIKSYSEYNKKNKIKTQNKNDIEL